MQHGTPTGGGREQPAEQLDRLGFLGSGDRLDPYRAEP